MPIVYPLFRCRATFSEAEVTKNEDFRADTGPRNTLRKVAQDFTIVPNEVIRSSVLSDAAKLLYMLALSHDAGWLFFDGQIRHQMGWGRDKLQAAKRQLEQSGLLLINERRGLDGRVSGYDWHLLPVPDLPVPDEPVPDEPAPESQAPLKEYQSEEYQSEEYQSDGAASAPRQPADLKSEREKGKSQQPQRARAAPIGDWFPPDDLMVWAEMHLGTTPLGAMKELEAFRDHHLGKGSVMCDWGAAFRSWCRRSGNFKTKSR